MKVLIGIPSPRDIPDFLEAMAWIPDDKIWVKYYDEYSAYKYIRKFFLKVKDYTHLCIIPDDLILKREQYDKLKTRAADGFPVIAGVLNADFRFPDTLNYHRDGKSIVFTDDMDDIQQVDHQAFGCCFIRREVVERISFDGAGAFDQKMDEELKTLGIPIYVDKSVKLLHLASRIGDGKWENLGIGIFVPKICYIQYV